MAIIAESRKLAKNLTRILQNENVKISKNTATIF